MRIVLLDGLYIFIILYLTQEKKILLEIIPVNIKLLVK